MRTSFTLLTLLVIVVAFVPWTHSQGIGHPGLGPTRPPEIPLIDDTKARAAISHVESVGRYSITMFKGEAILLDSVTGDTWRLTSTDEDDEPAFRWTAIPKSKDAQSPLGKRAKRAKESHRPDAFNPFGP